LKQGQISEIWPNKANLATLLLDAIERYEK